MLQSLLQIGIANREQRTLVQLACEVPQPDAAQSDGRGQVHPAYAECALAEVGHDKPVEIDETHDENQNGDAGEQLRAALDLAREQQCEGQREMQNHERESDVLPAALQA